MFRMQFSGFARMIVCVLVMSEGSMGVVGGFFMIFGPVVLGGLSMVLGGLLVVFGCFQMVLGCFF
jgi:hypothetical protein